MDVHAPHNPIHSWKDFLLHLVIITVGLLIAVGIEGLVELHREHKLVNEARTTMREEIESNLGSMKRVEANLKQERIAMKKDMDTLTRIQENSKDEEAQKTPIDATYSLIELRDTAWKTAQTTGALSFMPYAEAQHYSRVYSSQNDFLGQQDKILEDEAQFLGVVAKTNFGHNGVTSEQASMALERFGIWNAHLGYLDLMARVTTQMDQAFLEGKEPPHSFNMSGDE
ncbi:MAG: hypothetical protein ABI286_07430 [Edaphobacter sp.]